jgi:hypothetical protein
MTCVACEAVSSSPKSSALVTAASPGSFIVGCYAAARPLLNPQGGKGA